GEVGAADPVADPYPVDTVAGRDDGPGAVTERDHPRASRNRIPTLPQQQVSVVQGGRPDPDQHLPGTWSGDLVPSDRQRLDGGQIMVVRPHDHSSYYVLLVTEGIIWHL